MKQENFLFVDVVSAIFLLLLMVGNLFGLLYITNGNFVVSLLISLFIIVCYYFIIQLLKRSKERMINKSFMIPETLFFLVFILFGLASYFFLMHSLNIETNVKDNVIKTTNEKIQKVNELPLYYKDLANEEILKFEGDLYEKLTNYKSAPTIALKEKLKSQPFYIDSTVLQTPRYIDVRAITDARLQPLQMNIEKNVDELADLIYPKAKEYNDIFSEWQRMHVSKAHQELNNFLEKSYATTNEKISELPTNPPTISYEADNSSLPLNNPIELAKLFKPNYVIPAIVVILLHLFILIPFFTHKVRKYINPDREKGEIKGGHRL